MVSEKHTVVLSEHSIKPKQRQRLRTVCARWWWLFLLILTCVILIVVLPIVFVAYPKMAREQISKSSLSVKAMSIENPTPGSVDLQFTQVLHSNSSFHPTLYPFNASFYLLDNANNPPFASIRTPEIQASNGLVTNIESQQVNITHPEEFTRYVLLSLASEEFTIALRGKGDLKQGVLPKVSVGYDQNITMKGFNRLSGFALQSFHVLNSTEADGTNAIGTASIENPTVMTIDLGRVLLKMSVNNTDIGYSTIESLVLKPGNNLVQMRAEVYQLVVVGIVLERQNPILPVDIKGVNSSYDGQLLPYYTRALEATALQVDLNVTKAVEGSSAIGKQALFY